MIVRCAACCLLVFGFLVVSVRLGFALNLGVLLVFVWCLQTSAFACCIA